MDRTRPSLIRVPGAFRLATAIALAFLTSSCALMPAAAPTALEVENEDASSAALDRITVLDIDDAIVSTLAAVRPEGFAGQFSAKAPPADLKIAVGDSLQISVIEQSAGSSAAAGAAAGASPGEAPLAAMPFLPVTVDRSGTINVPFAGSVRAAGMTIEAVRKEIEHRLVDKAINPQVQVALVNGTMIGANSATVGGDVNRAGVLPLRPSGSRLLDVIAEAGGAHYPAFETTVHLNRGRREASVSLQRIVDKSDENVFIYPGDNVYVSHDPKTFTVLGSSTKVGRYPFGSESVNLAEAVAEAGGFTDAASDPSGVFVFRYEPLRVVKALRPDAHTEGEATPIIYRLNLREGGGYFRARRFSMRDKDIVLLANSDGAQLLKFVTLLQGITSTAQNVASTALTIKTIGSSNGAAVVTTSGTAATVTSTTP